MSCTKKKKVEIMKNRKQRENCQPLRVVEIRKRSKSIVIKNKKEFKFEIDIMSYTYQKESRSN